jgi:hypothetical protein
MPYKAFISYSHAADGKPASSNSLLGGTRATSFLRMSASVENEHGLADLPEERFDGT